MEHLKKCTWYKAPYLDLGDGFISYPLSQNGYSEFRKEEKYGVIDSVGNIVFEAKHDYPIEQHIHLIHFQGELNSHGLKTPEGKIIYPCTGWSYNFFESVSLHKISEGDDAFLFKDSGEQLKTELPLRDILEDEFSEGLIQCEFWTDEAKTNTADGFMDINGQLLITPQYRNTGKFSDGIAPVSDINWENPSYIDKTGKIVFKAPEDWIEIRSFEGPLATVSIKDKGTAYINRNFEIVIPPKRYGSTTGMFDDLYCFSNGDTSGAYDPKGNIVIDPSLQFADIQAFHKHKVIINKPHFKKQHKDLDKLWSWDNIIDQYGIFDIKKQEFVLSPSYNSIYVTSKTTVQVIDKNNKRGYISDDGTFITNIVFDDVNGFYQRKAWVKLDGLWGIIELK